MIEYIVSFNWGDGVAEWGWHYSVFILFLLNMIVSDRTSKILFTQIRQWLHFWTEKCNSQPSFSYPHHLPPLWILFSNLLLIAWKDANILLGNSWKRRCCRRKLLLYLRWRNLCWLTNEIFWSNEWNNVLMSCLNQNSKQCHVFDWSNSKFS